MYLWVCFHKRIIWKFNWVKQKVNRCGGGRERKQFVEELPGNEFSREIGLTTFSSYDLMCVSAALIFINTAANQMAPCHSGKGITDKRAFNTDSEPEEDTQY